MYSLIVFLPLIGALVAGLLGKSIGDRAAQIITSTGLVVSAVLGWVGLFGVAGTDGYEVILMEWIHSGNLVIDWAIKVDPLSAIMIVVVTSVSAVVHVYSIGYMSHDKSIARFMSYLSLFTFFMLMLVTSNNFIQLFFGWEGVGVASYLLIGFWYTKPSACAAAMKAFIVNRVGDVGLALGIAGVYLVFGSVEFSVVFAEASSLLGQQITLFGYQFDTLNTLCLLLFIGAMGKSAQLGLHTWLPDAMEGPTPVSALIHAATMVTAGVFLVARISPMMEYAPLARDIVAIVGATTALFAATIGMTQFDIKRVIAYSTCSQLGYMFFACGVGAYSVGIFHLFTHAFFKALLFLGAGSVIHAMSDEQDMRNMGGIRKLIPFTYAMMWIGSLALAGVPFFAGFFSKDLVLEVAYASHSGVGMYAFWLGIIAALMTAFYSWRLLFLTFHGKPRADSHVMGHVHESPLVMTVPLAVLAVGAVFAGYLGLSMVGADGQFWGQSIHMAADNNIIDEAHHVALWVKLLPVFVGASGIALAYWIYIAREGLGARIASTFSPLNTLFHNKWFFDEIYEAVFVKPAKWIGSSLSTIGDKLIIDGLGPNGIASSVLRSARGASALQTGFVFQYAFVMAGAMALLVTWFFVRW